jgi:hypothetical protein
MPYPVYPQQGQVSPYPTYSIDDTVNAPQPNDNNEQQQPLIQP